MFLNQVPITKSYFMNEQIFHLTDLVKRKIRGELTESEHHELDSLLNKSALAREAIEQLSNELILKEGLEKLNGYDLEKNRAYLKQILYDRILAASEHVPKEVVMPVKRLWWRRMTIAATVAGVLLLAHFLFNKESQYPAIKPAGSNHMVQDVPAPDKNRAQIKLSDGSILYLDSAGNGSVAEQAGVEIIKMADGRIEYIVDDGASSEAVTALVYNTLENPNGSKVIDMQLADGSHVWLNAGSSLRYPVRFSGQQRKVLITGEAYFEVSKNEKAPFVVDVNGTSIQVLGTHFNVNAYQEEGVVRTTLLEGAVKVSRNGAELKLVPGEQAAEKNGVLTAVKEVNLEQVMAWKNGSFYFDDVDIETVLREVARWYDIEVVYAGKIPEGHYRGKPSRSLSLTQLLKVIEYSGVKFKLEDKKLTILSNG